MLRSGLALAAGALALLVVSSAFEAADARDRRGGSGARSFHGGGGSTGGREFSGRRFHGGHHRSAGRHIHNRRFRGIGPGLAIGVPLGVYGAYAYTSGCDWLHRKAVITGNPYWWHRYELCLDGGY